MKDAIGKILLLTAFIGAYLLLEGCGGNIDPDAGSQRGIPSEELPTTPEEIVKRYQSYIDSNRFEMAQMLSTPRSAPLHEMMEAIIADSPSDSSIIHTEFIDLACEEKRDTVICVCLLRDEYEEYSSEYILVKNDGRWLVDLPDEEGNFELFEQETLEQWPEKQ